jgi:hypothetical protein
MGSDKQREKYLWNGFKLTSTEWEIVHTYQRGLCYLCGRPQEPRTKRLATDHAHDDISGVPAGTFRGLLCSRCNPLFGKIENAFKRYGLHKLQGVTLLGILKNLVSYVESPPAIAALGKMVIGFPGKLGTKRHKDWVRRNSENNKTKTKKKRI